MIRWSAMVAGLLLPAGTLWGVSLSGHVRDASGAPIGAALLRLEELARQTRSEPDGSFRFEPVPPGEYTITVTAERYRSGNRIRVRVEEGPAQVELTLTGLDTLKQALVVTGTATPHLLVDAPVRTELVTPEITRSLAKRTLSEALTATVPGVRVEINCTNCGFSAVRLNGLEGPYTQILEDGLPSFSGVTMVYGLDQIPTEFLEQLEVVKGGASALYGPNAVAGVINLVRREPKHTSVVADTQAGWQKGRPEQQAGAAAQVENLGAGFSGDFYYRVIRRTQIDRDRDGFTELPRRELQAGGGTLFRRFLDGRARLAFGASTFDEFRRGGSQFDLRPEQTFLTEQLLSGRSAGFVRWNHAVTPATYYSLNAGFSYFGRFSYYGVGFDPNAYGNTRNPLWNGDAQMGHQRGRHTLLAGVQHWREHVRDRIPAYDRAFDNRFFNTGFYLQDEWRASQRVVLVGGFRVDRNNAVASWVASPRANVRFGLTDNWNLRAGVSTGFRAPVIFDEDLHVAAAGGEGLLVERGPGLRAERSVSYSAALDHTGALRGRRFQAGAAFFWTRLRDNFQLREEEREGFRLLQRVNGAGSFVRGVDFSWNLQPLQRLTLRGGATLQLARYRQPEPQFGSLRFFRTPNRYGFLAASLDLPKGFDLAPSLDFTGRMLVPHYAGFIPEDRLQRSPPFAVWSVVAGKTIRSRRHEDRTLRFYVAALNLTDDVQRDFDQGPLRDSRYIYGPLQMRQFTCGLTARF